MTSGTFMMTCRKQKGWEICFDRLKSKNICLQTVKGSYHEVQHADYLKICNYLHDSPIYFYFRFTKISKIHCFL